MTIRFNSLARVSKFELWSKCHKQVLDLYFELAAQLIKSHDHHPGRQLSWHSHCGRIAEGAPLILNLAGAQLVPLSQSEPHTLLSCVDKLVRGVFECDSQILNLQPPELQPYHAPEDFLTAVTASALMKPGMVTLRFTVGSCFLKHETVKPLQRTNPKHTVFPCL